MLNKNYDTHFVINAKAGMHPTMSFPRKRESTPPSHSCESKNKITMDTRFRGYDRRNKWMPAFASMAEKYHSHTANCINNRYISIVKDIEGRLEMGYQKYESLVKELLAFAGIEINDSKPWDIQVYNKDF